MEPISLEVLGTEELTEYKRRVLDSLRHVEGLLQERAQCVVCMAAARAVVFLPCQHLVACAKCAEGVSVCPMCRKEIAQRLKPYA